MTDGRYLILGLVLATVTAWLIGSGASVATAQAVGAASTVNSDAQEIDAPQPLPAYGKAIREGQPQVEQWFYQPRRRTLGSRSWVPDRRPRSRNRWVYRVVPRAGLGVTLQDDGSEVRITGIYKESPALQAGLHLDDQIITLNKRRYATANSVIQAIGRMRPGDEFDIEILRQGQIHTVRATLDSRAAALAGGLLRSEEQPRITSRGARRQTVFRADVDTALQIQQMQQTMDNLANNVDKVRDDLTRIRNQLDAPKQSNPSLPE